MTIATKEELLSKKWKVGLIDTSIWVLMEILPTNQMTGNTKGLDRMIHI